MKRRKLPLLYLYFKLNIGQVVLSLREQTLILGSRWLYCTRNSYMNISKVQNQMTLVLHLGIKIKFHRCVIKTK